MRRRGSRRLAVGWLAVASLLVIGASGNRPWMGQHIYGFDILTADERREFRAKLNALETYDEKLALWRQHVVNMKQRAWDRGLVLQEPPEVMPREEMVRLRRPIHAMSLMTTEEVEAYRAEERALIEAGDAAAVEAFMKEHDERMKRRAEERGLTYPTRRIDEPARKRSGGEEKEE